MPSDSNDVGAQKFGGRWTHEKLQILEAYLDAYTTALKNQPFTLWYVDAFAGSGAIQALDDEAGRMWLSGSPEIALAITNKPFDRLLFIEKDKRNTESLRKRVANSEDADRAQVVQGDANIELPRFCNSMDPFDRAVVFLDPFGAEVDWSTVESLAQSQKCDVWILFPVSTIRRLLPRKGGTSHGAKLTQVFGDESWRKAQYFQSKLFEDKPEIRTRKGIGQITQLYMDKLKTVFAGVAAEPREFKNSNNSPLYWLMFAVSNPAPAAKDHALKIADHILTKM